MIIAELHEEKINVLNSIFIACSFPILDVKSFDELYSEFKKIHPKADHYPYAYIVDGYEKASDDGEPSNAASKNLVGLLKDKNLNKSGVMIARYFGGTKLGLPRLRKTFLNVAILSIDNASKGEIVTKYIYELSLTYSEFDYLKRNYQKYDLELLESNFELDVKVKIKTIMNKAELSNALNYVEEKFISCSEVKEVERL